MSSRRARPNKSKPYGRLQTGMKGDGDNESLPGRLQVLAKDDCKIKLMKSGNGAKRSVHLLLVHAS